MSFFESYDTMKGLFKSAGNCRTNVFGGITQFYGGAVKQ